MKMVQRRLLVACLLCGLCVLGCSDPEGEQPQQKTDMADIGTTTTTDMGGDEGGGDQGNDEIVYCQAPDRGFDFASFKEAYQDKPCTGILGDLELESSSEAMEDFVSGLRVILGTLIITVTAEGGQAHPQVLPNLKSVENLSIRYSTSKDLSFLSSIEVIEKNINFFDNEKLGSFEGLNPKLKDFKGEFFLSAHTDVGQLESIRGLPFEELESVTVDAVALRQFDGLENLRRVEGDFEISGSFLFENFDGLSNLKYVGGALRVQRQTVEGCPEIALVESIGRENIVGQVVVFDCTK